MRLSLELWRWLLSFWLPSTSVVAFFRPVSHLFERLEFPEKHVLSTGPSGIQAVLLVSGSFSLQVRVYPFWHPCPEKNDR